MGARRHLVASVLGIALLASGPSWAQEAGSFVDGTVIDDRTGEPVEGIAVVGVHVEPDPNIPPDASAGADEQASGASGETTSPAGACGCPVPPPGVIDDLGVAPERQEFDRFVTGADGRFNLEGVAPAADWSVRVQIIDETGRSFRYVRQELEVELDASGSATLDVRLTLSGQVHGRVVDAQTGEAIPSVNVAAFGSSRSVIVTTDSAGAFFARDVAPGSYTVRFAPTLDSSPSRHYRSQYFDGVVEVADATVVAVSPGEATSSIDAALVPGASLAGSVVADDGLPLEAIGVRVVDADTGDSASITSTDAGGEWQVDGLAAGHYQVHYTRPSYTAIQDVAPAGYAATWAGGSSVREDADVAVAEAGELTRLDPTRVVPAGAIRGRLAERVSTVPLRDACVTVVDEAGRKVGGGETTIGVTRGPGAPLLGEYEVDELPPGTHRVLFETRGCGSGPDDQPSHEPRWHGDAATLDEAAPVTVSSVEVVSGVDGVLDPRPPLGFRAGVVGQVGRVAGPDRIETAIEIARRATERFGAHTVVIARADQYADALAGGPLATRFAAPILLSGGGGLDGRVAALVTTMAPQTAYLLGGETALSPQVAQDLRQVGVADVVRVAGDDRFATAAAIADLVVSQAERERGSPTAYLVEGANADPSRGWPDALAAAAEGSRPVLLTTRDALPEATREALGIFVAVTIVGGEAAVSREVEDEVFREGVEAYRVAGATRYETFQQLSRDPSHRPWLVTGRDWPDALTAGAGAYLDGGSLVLVDGTAAPPAEDLRVLDSAFSDLERVLLIGGANALSQALEDDLRERAAAGPAGGEE